MKLLEAAGLPAGVINLLHGPGPQISEVLLADPRLAGIHFTGSTATFQHLWRQVGANIGRYHTYPRLVGETGGKDFILAHSSADPEALTTALIRGAFDYQGQKCSAASRAFIPKSVWARMGEDLLSKTAQLAYGDVADFANFGGAVIDRASFGRNAAALARAKSTPGLTVAVGGKCDDTVGYFVEPTILLGEDPGDEAFRTEYFGPILAVHIYDDASPGSFAAAVRMVDEGSRYALTGAVVGQQPFGGGRASGTNDKAGSRQNLLRWTSARTINETFVPPIEHRYPHQG